MDWVSLFRCRRIHVSSIRCYSLISQDTSVEMHDESLAQLTSKSKKERVDGELKVKVENPKYLKLHNELKVVSSGVARLEKQVAGLRNHVAILKAIPNPTFAWLREGA